MNFWPEKFFGSTRVASLHGHAQGAYVLLLLREHMAAGRGLPTSSRELAQLCALTEREWQKLAPTVIPFFDERDGRLYNQRVEEGLEEVRDRHQRLSALGRNGAAKRWHGKSSYGQAIGQAITVTAIKRPIASLYPVPLKEEPPQPPQGGGVVDSASPGKKNQELEARWQAFEEQASRQASVRRPKAFTRNLRKRYATPEETGEPWYVPPAKVEDDRRRALALKALKRLAAKHATWREGEVEWGVYDVGLVSAAGARHYSAMATEELERLVEVLTKERPA